MLKYINITCAVFSRLFIFAGFVLGYLSKKKMGVLRSMMYRNEKILNTVLSPIMQYVYIFIILMIVLWLCYLILEKKAGLKETYPVWATITMALLALYFVSRIPLVPLPMVTIGILLGVLDSTLKVMVVQR